MIARWPLARVPRPGELALLRSRHDDGRAPLDVTIRDGRMVVRPSEPGRALSELELRHLRAALAAIATGGVR